MPSYGLKQEIFFQNEQFSLDFDAASVAGEGSVGADDAMAGDDDGYGIGSVCRSHGPDGTRIPDVFGDLSIGSRLTVRDFGYGVPHGFLKIGAVEVERKVEFGAGFVEVFLELPAGVFVEFPTFDKISIGEFVQERRERIRILLGREDDAYQSFFRGGDEEYADGCDKVGVMYYAHRI